MRYVFTFALTFALLSMGPAMAQVEKEVSDITGTERISSTDMRNLVTESYPGHASFQAEYEKPEDDDPIWRISFYGFADDTTAMNAATDVRIEADGQPITPHRVQSKLRQMDQSVLEIKHAAVSRSDFETIATATDVTATIGSLQFELTHYLRKDLRKILDRVPKDKGPQTASSDESEQ